MGQIKIGEKKYKFDIYFLLSVIIVYFLTYFIFYFKLFSNSSGVFPAEDFNVYGAHSGDLYVHTLYVKSLIADPSDFTGVIASYPIWHLTVWFGNLITGIDIFNMAVIITSLFNAFTAGVLYYILNKKLGEYITEKYIIFLIAVSALMIMPIYAPWFNKYFTLGQWSPNAWHSPTYIAVRPVALITVYYWVEIINKYSKNGNKDNELINRAKPRMTRKEFIILTVLLVISLFLKPSFIQFFLPAALLFLLIECIITKGCNIFIFLQLVCIFIIPFIIFAVQYNQIFNDEGIRAGIAFGFAKSWLIYTDNIVISFLLSALFPLFVVIINIKNILKNKYLLFSLIMLITALCEYTFLYEKGFEKHSNLGWGYMLALFFIWVFGIITFVKNYCAEKNQLTLKKYISVNIGFGLLIIYIIYGIYYYVLLYGTPEQLF